MCDVKCSICEAQAIQVDGDCGKIFKCSQHNHFGDTEGRFVDLSGLSVKAEEIGFSAPRCRATITVQYEVNLDMVPGWGANIEDWIKLLQDVEGNMFLRQKHYTPTCRIKERNVRLVPNYYINRAEETQ